MDDKRRHPGHKSGSGQNCPQNRQNRHFPRRRRSPNATGSVLSRFFQGFRYWIRPCASVAQDRQRPASGSEESDTAARSKRRRRRMPAQDQNCSRQKKNHQKQIHAGIIAQPAAQQRPRQVQPARAAYAGRPVSGSIPHTRRAALSVPCAVVVQDHRISAYPARRLTARSSHARRRPTSPLMPPSAGSAEERTSRHANAVTRSRSTRGRPPGQKKSEAAVHTPAAVAPLPSNARNCRTCRYF